MSADDTLDAINESLQNARRGYARRGDLYDDSALMDYDHNISISLAPLEMRRLLDTSSQSMCSFSMQSVAQQDHLSTYTTAKSKTDTLYDRFLETIQCRTQDVEIFDTIQDLIHLCTEVMEEVALNDRHMSAQMGIDFWLNQERNTWRLLYCLYKDRLIVQKEDMDCDDFDLVESEKLIVESLFAKNSTLREYQLVVDWLEQCALEQGSIEMGHFTDRTVAWENTLHKLQQIGLTAFGGRQMLVESLDPDAPHREKRSLHELDREDELRLSKQIFCEIRQGQIEKAQTLCEHCGQSWRAAMLEGWRLFHDPNFEENSDSNQKMPIEGNSRRDLWKKCAWMMAERGDLEVYTRAIAGVLCGHLQSLLSASSETWVDLLWAYLKVQIDVRVEHEIRSTGHRTYLPMPDQYWENKMTLEQIFDELTAHKNQSVKETAASTMNIIQKYIILDDIPELMRQIATWLNETKMNPQMLRFLTHLVLFMRQIDTKFQADIGDRVIKNYAEALFDSGSPGLIAYYISALPGDSQVLVYSKYLQTLRDSQKRKNAYIEGGNTGLNMDEITCYTVETVREQQSVEDDQKLLAQGQIGELDALKISCLEWLTFGAQQMSALLWNANALIRNFLAENKVECVRATFKMVPSDAIALLVQNYGTDLADVPVKEDCTIKEFLCHQTYLAAIDGFSDWATIFNKKPKAPEVNDKVLNFTERMAIKQKETSFKQELQQWQMNMNSQKDVTVALLHKILMFPAKGWLVDTGKPELHNESDLLSWENRVSQLDNLRKLCIPEVAMLIIKVQHLCGDYRGCLDLANEIAFENRKLYEIFPKQKMAEFLTKVADASLAMINEGYDAWGFDVTS